MDISGKREALRKKHAVVVTGMSGRLPQSDTIEEFERNLYNGVDMVTADDARWPMGEFFSFW